MAGDTCTALTSRRAAKITSWARAKPCTAGGLGAEGLFFPAQQAQHLAFVFRTRVVQQHLHQEAVHLRFRQRISAFLFDRVLRGDDDEQLRQRVAVAGHGDLPFFHGFKQRGLDFGRGAVDFVGQDQVAEQRPRLEADLVLALDLVQHLGAGDVRGQQVGGELDAAHFRVQVFGKGFHRAGLGQPRQAFQQQMPVGQQTDENLPDHLVLAEHRFGDAGLQSVEVVECAHACS